MKGIYQHYKGKRYEVIGIGRHSETLEEMVLYRGLYDDPLFGPSPLWVRPVSSFEEIIEVNGRYQPRFEKKS